MGISEIAIISTCDDSMTVWEVSNVEKINLACGVSIERYCRVRLKYAGVGVKTGQNETWGNVRQLGKMTGKYWKTMWVCHKDIYVCFHPFATFRLQRFISFE